MMALFEILQSFLNTLFFIFGFVIVLSYIILSLVSYFALRKYVKKSSFTVYDRLTSSPFAPGVSVIAPAYNESKTIIENIRALMSLYYQDYEVIIVNDGSKDDSLEKVIEHYKMVKVDYAVNYQLESKKIKGIYKSTDKSFSKLLLLDKENGGKADALNAGINISNKDLFVVIDVDSIIEHDALQKLVKPFLEEKDEKILATGSVIRVANSCEVDHGKIVNVRFPKQLLAQFQTLEYNRAFLMGRMAWGKLNGLLLISGAIGMFDKACVISAGGYNTQTVGEDMELIVRMRRYMEDKREKYKVIYIPDPLCWTEVPTKLKVLERQRNRWTRGTIETLTMHKKLFFNPKYGVMGMFGYPYWFFFEWLAPIVELFGITYFLILSIMGQANWPFFFLMLAFIYSFAISFSIWSIVYGGMSFNRYKSNSDFIRQILTAIIEPIIYHPFIIYFAVKGNIDYFRGVKSWGKMDREGFQSKTKTK